MDEEEEQLYLLEVMVDRLVIHKEGILGNIDKTGESEDPTKKKDALSPIKVKVKFFDFPTIEINEEEFKSNIPQEDLYGPQELNPEFSKNDTFLEDAKKEEERWRAKNAGMSVEMWRNERERDRKLATEVAGTLPPGNRFTSGKSCLFPMLPKEMIKTLQKYPLEVQVMRMSEKRAAYIIGHVKIELGPNFTEAVVIATTPVVLPVSAFVEEKFVLKNIFGEPTADIFLFVRLSCFGATIFTQFKYIQGDKGLKSKVTEACKAKKCPQEKKNKEEEINERHPCYATEDILPVGKSYASPHDDFALPVRWRNIYEPTMDIQMCFPQEFAKEPPQMDIGYKCALANDESVNLSKMFPGISHPIPKYGLPCETNMTSSCPCPTNQYGIQQSASVPIDPSAQQQFCRMLPSSNIQQQPFKCNYPPAWNAPPFPKSASYRGMQFENNLGVVVSETNTSRAISGIPSDSEWDKTNSSINKVRKPKVIKGSIINSRPMETDKKFVKSSPNTSCPAFKDGKCRCPKQFEQRKPQETRPTPQRVPAEQTKDVKIEIGDGGRATGGTPNIKIKRNNGGFPGERGGGAGKGKQIPTERGGLPPCEPQTCPDLKETSNMIKGLGQLCEPIYQNMNKIMPPYVITPHSPGAPNTVSICTCPKVPDFIPPTQFGAGNYIRCECSNILTSLNPVNVPYKCPLVYPDPKKTDMIKGPIAPKPIVIKDKPLDQPSAEEQKIIIQPQTPYSPSLPSVALSDESVSGESWENIKEHNIKKKVQEKKKKKHKTESDPELKKKCKDKEKDKRKSPVSYGADSSERVAHPDYDSTAHKMLEEELDYYETMVEDIKQQAKDQFGRKAKKRQESYEIEETPSSESTIENGAEENEPKKRSSIAYRYTAGMYPGIHIGHKECIVPYRMVPKNMGWLWNIKNAAGIIKPGRGWRPGAIAENVAEIMDAAKNSTQKGLRKRFRRTPRSAAKKKDVVSEISAGGDGLHKQTGKKNAKLLKEGTDLKMKDKDGETVKETEDLRPTLHVHKKHGLYYVSMFPPKKDGVDLQPIQFKIDPKHPDGPGGDSSLYESDDTSTNTEDSFQLEFVAPHTLRSRIPPKAKRDMQCQVSEEVPEQLPPQSVRGGSAASKKSKGSKKSMKGKKKTKGKKGKKGTAKGKKGKK